MSTLEGKKVSETYKDLLQISNNNQGIDTTIRYIEDGEGTPSVLGLSDTHVSVNGNVGIGTTSPDEKLDLASGNLQLDNAFGIKTTHTNGTRYMQLQHYSDDVTYLDNVGTGITFRTGPSSASSRMHIDSDGNVGIGTTEPDTKLEISGTGSQSIKITSTDTGAVNNPAMALMTIADTGELVLYRGSEGGTGVERAIRIVAGTNNSGYITFDTGGGTTPLERMRIDPNGNVGIGTTSPSATLDVQGDVIFNDPSSSLTSIFSSDAGGVYLNLNANNGSHVISYEGGEFSINDSSASTERMHINSDGKVGIGTTSPSAKLDVLSSSSAEFGLSVYNSTSTGNGAFIKGGGTSGQFRLKVESSENTDAPFVVKGDGKVGIGTTSPDQPLQVEITDDTAYSNAAGANLLRLRNNSLADDSYAGIEIYGGQQEASGSTKVAVTRIYAIKEDSSSTASALAFATRSSNTAVNEAMRINSDGNVGIGTTDPNRALEVHSQAANGIVLRGAAPNGLSLLDIRKTDGGNTEFNNTHYTGGTSGNFSFNADVEIVGNISKSSGTFKIDHPLPEKSETHHLVHSFLESPQVDNIYRGKIELVAGKAEVNIDSSSGMSDGTFVALNRDIQIFTSNESDWDPVRGKVEGNKIIIECQNAESTATVSWLVIGERQDEHIRKSSITDDNGKLIVEPLKPEPEPEIDLPAEEVTVSLGGSVSIGASISGQALTELSDSRAEETAE